RFISSKDENEIKVIFHVHLPEGIEQYGQPAVLGDVKDLGSWKKPNVKLYQPYPKNLTYWQSNPVTISTSNIGRNIHYKYALTSGQTIEFEGQDNRTLDTTRNDQFDIWKNSYELPRLSP